MRTFIARGTLPFNSLATRKTYPMIDQTQRLIVAQVALKAAVELRAAGDETSITSLARNVQELIYKLAREAVHAPYPPRRTDQDTYETPARSASAVISQLSEEAGTRQVAKPLPPENTETFEENVVETFTTPAGAKPTVVDSPEIPEAGPIGADSPDAVLWADALRHNPSDWHNNLDDERASVNGGRGPDFRHKKLKKNNYNLGLWINAGSTPVWVRQALKK